jgi:hypothetical protein
MKIEFKENYFFKSKFYCKKNQKGKFYETIRKMWLYYQYETGYNSLYNIKYIYLIEEIKLPGSKKRK